MSVMSVNEIERWKKVQKLRKEFPEMIMPQLMKDVIVSPLKEKVRLHPTVVDVGGKVIDFGRKSVRSCSKKAYCTAYSLNPSHDSIALRKLIDTL